MESLASMGPPFFDGGNRKLCPDVRLDCKLQWGRRFLTAETQLTSAAWSKRLRLQWGRRFLTAETFLWTADNPVHRIASMGPPFFDGGNTSLPPTMQMSSQCFNGAAVF